MEPITEFQKIQELGDPCKVCFVQIIERLQDMGFELTWSLRKQSRLMGCCVASGLVPSQ